MMLPTRSLSIVILAVALFAMPQISMSAEPDQTVQATFTRLLGAVVANDDAAFTADCDATMKAASTKPVLESVSKQVEPRAKGGYDAQYLGELSQRGFAVHLWRLRFKDGGDDLLATVSLKDGKVGGFYLH